MNDVKWNDTEIETAREVKVLFDSCQIGFDDAMDALTKRFGMTERQADDLLIPPTR